MSPHGESAGNQRDDKNLWAARRVRPQPGRRGLIGRTREQLQYEAEKLGVSSSWSKSKAQKQRAAAGRKN